MKDQYSVDNTQAQLEKILTELALGASLAKHKNTASYRELVASVRYEEALEALTKLIESKQVEAVEEAKLGWVIELPDLKFFQIIGSSLGQWESPMYEVKNLPAKLKSQKQGRDGE